ncbi:MAG: iron-containing alcohol dehydrogenase [Thermocladium sp.]
MPIITLPRKIIFQRDIYKDASDILGRYLGKKALVIVDPNVLKIHGEKIKEMLRGVEYLVWSEVPPEPSIDDVLSAYMKMRGDYTSVVAVGGGSVIDFAKSMAYLLSNPNGDLRSINPFEPINLTTTLIAVPTTSGTGSDASFGVVLTDDGRKLAMGNYDLVPLIIVLDPSFAPTQENIVRSTGLDALVHAFEALVANTASLFTDALAEKAILTIIKNLPLAIVNDNDAKDAMHIAATMAGMAFSNSGTAMAHALGHAFGATFHIVHGTSVALFLPHVIKFNSMDATANEKYRYISKLLGFGGDIDGLINGLLRLYREIKQPITVRELGIDKAAYFSAIDSMTRKAIEDSELSFNPVIPGEDDIKSIYDEAW